MKRFNADNKVFVGFAVIQDGAGAAALFQKELDKNTVIQFYVDVVDEDSDGPFVIIGETAYRPAELLQALLSFKLTIEHRLTIQCNNTHNASLIGWRF